MISKQTNLTKIQRIRDFKKGWFDGKDGEEFNKEFLDKIEDILNNLDFQIELFPLCDGDIQLEYDRDDRVYIEFTFNHNDMEYIKVWIFNDKDDGTYYTIKFDIKLINDIIKNFLDGNDESVITLLC